MTFTPFLIQIKQRSSVVRTDFLIELVLVNSSNSNLILGQKLLTHSGGIANTHDFK